MQHRQNLILSGLMDALISSRESCNDLNSNACISLSANVCNHHHHHHHHRHQQQQQQQHCYIIVISLVCHNSMALNPIKSYVIHSGTWQRAYSYSSLTLTSVDVAGSVVFLGMQKNYLTLTLIPWYLADCNPYVWLSIIFCMYLAIIFPHSSTIYLKHFLSSTTHSYKKS